MSEITEFDPTTTRIQIPEGKFSAPGDHEIVTGHYSVFGRNKQLELIQQTYSGNCAEYTALDAALVLKQEGFVINPAVYIYLGTFKKLDMDLVERDLVIPFLRKGQREYHGISTSEPDRGNLDDKDSNPYTALTGVNSALLFRMTVSPDVVDFKPNDLATTYSEDLEDSIKGNETLAIFIGSASHATAYIKLGPNYIHIDPYFNDGVTRTDTEAEALQHIQGVLSQGGSFVTLNQLRTSQK